jgi:nitrate reductase NapE component
MSKRAGVLVVIAAGGLWGLSEVFLGDVFYMFRVPMRAASLTAVGLAFLVISRLLFDRPGTSIAAGLLAGAIRCLVPKLYICHFIAIAIEAAAFDAGWTALRAGRARSVKRAWLAAAIGAYTSFLAFGFVGAYGFGFGRWVAAGLGGILSWTLRSGTVTSLLLLGLVPLASYAALRLRRSAKKSPQEHTSLS